MYRTTGRIAIAFPHRQYPGILPDRPRPGKLRRSADRRRLGNRSARSLPGGRRAGRRPRGDRQQSPVRQRPPQGRTQHRSPTLPSATHARGGIAATTGVCPARTTRDSTPALPAGPGLSHRALAGVGPAVTPRRAITEEVAGRFARLADGLRSRGSPASLESWPGEGSMTSGCRRSPGLGARGVLYSSTVSVGGKNLAARQVRRSRRR
jgi:hypothetical protein